VWAGLLAGGAGPAGCRREAGVAGTLANPPSVTALQGRIGITQALASGWTAGVVALERRHGPGYRQALGPLGPGFARASRYRRKTCLPGGQSNRRSPRAARVRLHLSTGMAGPRVRLH